MQEEQGWTKELILEQTDTNDLLNYISTATIITSLLWIIIGSLSGLSIGYWLFL